MRLLFNRLAHLYLCRPARRPDCLAQSFLLALTLILGADQLLWAQQPSFPRGPGFYFSIYKLAAILLIYFIWVSLCSWVDSDSQDLKLDTFLWNPLMTTAGALGLIAVWIIPFFWLGLLAFILFFVGIGLWYANIRNQKVRYDERVLTKKHLRSLLRRYLRLNIGEGGRKGKGPRVPVRFIGRGFDQKEEDPNRVKRAQESRGYKGALEMVYEAVTTRVTDIHMEPTKEEMAVRFRVDGILNTVTPFSRHMGEAVINIFKVLSNMDITEKRKPQDGSFSAQVEERLVDFRVATAGGVAGEKMVMRILDKSQQIINLTQLGMRDKMRDQIHGLVTQPHGMLVVCGPTGAGKSTTLYACLNEIDRLQQNIITIENPVEYQLDHVTQIEVNVKAGKTFASELRSILRQDPDVIMIGEIRDQETAEIACQAAQTGHLVFSTIHANDTVTALGRLLDLGVQPFMIASALNAVLGQRLVRLLCARCKVKYKPNPELLRKANLPAEKIKFFYRPPTEEELAERNEEAKAKNKRVTDEELVCERCGNTGYFKRTGVFELLVLTDKIRDMIRENPNLNAIRQEAVKSGMRYLYEDGLRQVLEGGTSIQELLRVSK
ncbi:MAG: type II/IV secretion system protein [Planctomycetes bacterium]|nr:type II/IV secretion system protein [Planctomycetota bacterium]